ncbi:hypothetical protein [Pseudochrobactrum sp. AO18b]|uniref:hypothetical protein n=1 Tax=Pseudochrobactrum sp. AO18b TaxID=1201036 RepID=UPI0003B51ADE|nr:hypothetical protein [Pseudochrobactrum sp. AO18b]MBX8812128.1 hypothetical protein [Ochrobactrum sp. MR34]
MQFDQNIPASCPPSDVDVAGVVYRAVEKLPLAPQHFHSWVKSGQKNAKATDCRHWGISVWDCLEAVEHARNINPLMRERFIAEGKLQPGDGVIKHTPTKSQPMHCTLWYDINVNMPQRFSIVLEPELEVF